jgi:hypothetical protein
VGRVAPVGEDARVDPRVERLDPAVQALREAGELLDGGDRDARRGDARGRRAGRDERDAGVVQAARQLLEPRLVVDADECPPNRSPVVLIAHGMLTFLPSTV